MGLWVADGEKGLMRETAAGFRRIGEPGYALCSLGGKVFCAGASVCRCCDGRTGEVLFDFPIPPGVCALCAFQGMACALSTEADCVAAYAGTTGELRYTAPAGAYPRGLCPCGGLLAAAGGAAGEILLLDPELRLARRFPVPGAACAVCCHPRGLYALCAAGDGEPTSLLLRLTPRGVREEVFSAPQPPASLCVLPDGRLLVGCGEGVWVLRPNGTPAARLPCRYPARIRPSPAGVLVCDSWQGTVKQLSGRVLYRGGEPLDVLETG